MIGLLLDGIRKDSAPQAPPVPAAEATRRVMRAPRAMLGELVEGRYLLRDVLGEGSMGVVYRAAQVAMGREVALKVLKPQHFKQQEKIVRFMRELEVVSRLTHPNIVRVFDAGDLDDGGLYIVMELVEGRSLREMMLGHRANLELALEVTYQICAALCEPHAQGIIHRDIKPDNILLQPMLDDSLQVKVVDFGVARGLASDAQVTGGGVVVGTPEYMAPELGSGDALDLRSDLYAVGVMLFEMLTGYMPFTAETPIHVVLKHISEPAPRLKDYYQGSFEWPELDALVDELMAKQPCDRPASAREVCRRIDVLRQQYGIERLRLDSELALTSVFEEFFLEMPRLDSESPRGQTALMFGPETEQGSQGESAQATKASYDTVQTRAARNVLPTAEFAYQRKPAAPKQPLQPALEPVGTADELSSEKRQLVYLALAIVPGLVILALLVLGLQFVDLPRSLEPHAAEAASAASSAQPNSPSSPGLPTALPAETNPEPVIELAPVISAASDALQRAQRVAAEKSEQEEKSIEARRAEQRRAQQARRARTRRAPRTNRKLENQMRWLRAR